MTIIEMTADEIRDLIREEIKQGFKGMKEDRMVGRKEAAKILGVCIGTIVNMQKRGDIVNHGGNGHPRYKLSQILKYESKS